MPGLASQPFSERTGQGFVLVLTLVILGLLTSLAFQAQSAARLALRTETRRAQRDRLRAAAADAAWEALRRLAADDNLLVDHTNEPWAEPAAWRLPDGTEVSVAVADENRCFNVNNLALGPVAAGKRAPLDVVRDLLPRHPDPAAQALRLRDRIDPGREGAGIAGATNAVSDAWLESPGELAELLATDGYAGGRPPGLTVLPLRQPGWTAVAPAGREIPARLEPVNLNTASREVLLALLGPENSGAVMAICTQRESAPLVSLAVLGRLLKTGADNPWASACAVCSSFFSVTARAEQAGCRETVYVLAARDAQGSVGILRWVCR